MGKRHWLMMVGVTRLPCGDSLVRHQRMVHDLVDAHLADVAMILGALVAVAIGCGLIALMYYSQRKGYDDALRNDRGREPETPRRKAEVLFGRHQRADNPR